MRADLTFWSSVMNHPEVAPFMGGPPPIDVAAIFAAPGVRWIQSESGGFLAAPFVDAPRVYHVHAAFLPTRTRAEVLTTMRLGMRLMFEQTPCVELVAAWMTENLAAIGLARIAGFRRDGTRWRLSKAQWEKESICLQ
jgi:hypothetical protein